MLPGSPRFRSSISIVFPAPPEARSTKDLWVPIESPTSSGRSPVYPSRLSVTESSSPCRDRGHRPSPEPLTGVPICSGRGGMSPGAAVVLPDMPYQPFWRSSAGIPPVSTKSRNTRVSTPANCQTTLTTVTTYNSRTSGNGSPRNSPVPRARPPGSAKATPSPDGSARPCAAVMSSPVGGFGPIQSQHRGRGLCLRAGASSLIDRVRLRPRRGRPP